MVSCALSRTVKNLGAVSMVSGFKSWAPKPYTLPAFEDRFLKNPYV